MAANPNLRDHVRQFLEAAYSAKSSEGIIAVINHYYSADVEQNEAGQAVRKGLTAVIEHEKEFFTYLATGHFDKVDIHSVNVDGSRTFTEHTGWATFKGAPASGPFHQLVQHDWKDGKIVKEVFWHEKPEQKH